MTVISPTRTRAWQIIGGVTNALRRFLRARATWVVVCTLIIVADAEFGSAVKVAACSGATLFFYRKLTSKEFN